MDLRNKQTSETTTWVPNNSMGEALSIVCTALMYPGGYYPNLGPRIWNWLNYRGLSRNRFRYSFELPNYIDENGPTDSDPITYGCGVVFIYYLLSQLNHSIQDIITKAGTTLGETYSNLEHRSDGWKRLHDLLALYYPEGAA